MFDGFRKLIWPYLLLLGSVIAVFWKLVLTREYTFLDNPDLAFQVLPWLEAQVTSIRHGSILLWTPYEWFGQSLIGQMQPGATNPFTYLLALGPLEHGQVQIASVHIWFVAIHCVAAVFAFLLLRDLGCAAPAAVLGGVLYATAGFCGNTGWPAMLTTGIWAPLVFLFLLRMLRGEAPDSSAAWAGVMLGASWLCGHHEPAIMLTLAAAGACVAAIVSGPDRMRTARRSAVVFLFMALLGAPLVLPAIEYGKLAKRWTDSGAVTWKDRLPVTEHEKHALSPADLVHVVLPGGNGLRTDPFTGVVGLSLAAVAVTAGFRRREVRLFLVLGICALLYAMARNNALYGPLFALLPGVEKARSPVMAVSVFHLAAAALAGLGAHLLWEEPGAALAGKVARAAGWLGAAIASIYVLHAMTPLVPVTGDTRPAMTGFVALLLAGVYQAWSRGYLRPPWALGLLGLLLVVEQSNETGWNWTHASDLWQASHLKPLAETRDVGDFLRGLPGPKRVHVNDSDIHFSFGDWYRLDAGYAFTASIPTQTTELNWWQERLIRMYGIDYEVSKAPTRAGQVECFRGASGLAVYRNPEAFPRAWTVHRVAAAADEKAARDLVRDGPVDLRVNAVMAGAAPTLDDCGLPDRVEGVRMKDALVSVRVDMACRGMVIVSDSEYPGWRADVDGSAAPIWRVNTVIRGVVVERGRHTVTMRYRPWTVYAGLTAALIGMAAAVALQRRETRRP